MDATNTFKESLEEFQFFLKDCIGKYKLKYMNDPQGIKKYQEITINIYAQVDNISSRTNSTKEQEELERLKQEIQREQEMFKKVLDALEALKQNNENVDITVNESPEDLRKRMEQA
ncbi:hypothetical protein [Scytonema sp. PCC 10023]|uniref:hypothetical protein n=1 Tax=Scytonema sp. PCC 10023 TaxID=1680591 RepID=UPI0039C5EFE1